MTVTVEKVEDAFRRESTPAIFAAYARYIPVLFRLFTHEELSTSISLLRLTQVRRDMAVYMARDRVDSKPRQLALRPYVDALEAILQDPTAAIRDAGRSSEFDYLTSRGLRKAGVAFKMGIIARYDELLVEHPSEFLPPLS